MAQISVELDSLVSTTPEDTQYNYARVNAFRLVALELPNVDFYCQLVSMPSAVMAEGGVMSNPLNDYPITGTKLDYGELLLTFIVDEKFSNYRSIYDWIVGITFPQDHDQFVKHVNRKVSFSGGLGFKQTESIIRSDLYLHVLDSMSQPIVRYHFHDAFPTRLEPLPFDVTITDINYFTVATSFKFSYYTIEDID